MKEIIAAAFPASLVVQVSAQSGANSPYSQHGSGALASQATSFNRGMNGLAYGFHECNQVNYANPASYASVDSLSFIFDAGVSLQPTNFEKDGNRVSAKNADIEYVVASFRAFKHVGVSSGLLPYTNVGYNFGNTQNVNALPGISSVNVTYSNAYSGSDGLHLVYLGTGWEPFKDFSFGANIDYLWRTLNRNSANTYSDNYVNTLSKNYSAQVKSYKVGFGAQYTCAVDKKNELTLGLTYFPGHNLWTEAECNLIPANLQTSVSDTTRYVIPGSLELPHTFGTGLMWNHNNRLKFGVDYRLQKWAELKCPQSTTVNGIASYNLVDGQFNDRYKLTLGGDYCKGEHYRGFFNRMHYRADFSYASPYLKTNGVDGPRKLSASLGVGIPILSAYNNRSMLNINAEWVNQSVTGMVKENMFRINVGFIFNERQFAKFKVE